MKTIETSASRGEQQAGAAPGVPETTKLQRRPLTVVVAVVLVCLGGVLGLWLSARRSNAAA